MIASVRRRNGALAAGGVLWAASFVLPSVRWESLGHLRADLGYVVARDSFLAMIDSFSPKGGLAPSNWQGFALIFAWAANVLVVPFCGLRGAVARAAIVAGLLLAWCPLATGLRPNLWVGYFVWAASLTLLGSGPWLRPWRAGARAGAGGRPPAPGRGAA